jgi:hypothetical protein
MVQQTHETRDNGLSHISSHFVFRVSAYTRESWAWKPSAHVQTISIRSTDGRHKLPGFVSFLKQRQKSAFGRFPARGLLVVSYIQSSSNGDPDRMDCRITLDFADLPNCALKPMTASAASTQQLTAVNAATTTRIRPSVASSTTAGPAVNSTSSKKTGLLGKLVIGAQRTQQSMMATAKPNINDNLHPTDSTSTAASVLSSSNEDTTATTDAIIRSTAQQVLADFRETMQQKMLDFELSADETMSVELSLPTYTCNLAHDDKARVTMDILKYMVYEAAEEINDQWIAHKEPTEFLDECRIAVYKEGCAPAEVLEDVNQAELPDEVRGQERAMAMERQKQLERQHLAQQKMAQEHAHKEQTTFDEDFEALNTQKRDRRTIADYEREKKRSK